MKKLLGLLWALTIILSLGMSAMADQGDASDGMVPFRFASKEEGTEMLLANKEYYAKFSPNKLAYTMQSNDATMEEYLAALSFRRDSQRGYKHIYPS